MSASDESDLALMQVVEVTGADVTLAKEYLLVTDGDPEAAIAFFLENDGRTLTSAPVRGPPNIPKLDHDYVREKIKPKKQTLYDDLEDAHEEEDYSYDIHNDEDDTTTHVQVTGNRIRNTVGRGSSSVFSPEFHLEDDSSASSTNAFAEKSTRLAELFRPPVDLMYASTFENAREKARKEKKYLMVTISDPSEFTCQMMNRDLWRDEAVKEIVKANFVFVLWNVGSPEGLKHKTYYPFDGFPYTAIIDPLTGERVKIWNGLIEKHDFVIEVSDFMERHTSTVSSSSKQPNKQKSEETKSLDELSEEEQLQRAIRESMASSGLAMTDNMEIDLTEDDTPNFQKPVDPFETIESKVSAEPTDDAIRVQFRWPDGSRVVRKFKNSDKVRVLFEFAKATVSNPRNLRFELFFFRDGLLSKLENTLGELKLGGATIALDFQE